MNVRRLAAAALVGTVLMAACSGDVRLPSPVAAPGTDATTTPPTTVPGATTTTVADPSGCVTDPIGTRNPDHSPTRSYEPTDALPTPGSMPAGTTMATIQQRGRLIVGVSA